MLGPALVMDVDFDLEEVREAVGENSFKRGRTYANKHRVMSAHWDPEELVLDGRVIGSGAIYETTASFSSDHGVLEFIEGECSCPIGWNCKHVAALALTAAGSPRARATPAQRSAGKAKLAAVPELKPAPPVPRAWEQSLRSMLTDSAVSAEGTPLAIELALVASGTRAAPGIPRLEAQLMRPGARGGWANGSLRWGSLEAWNFRDVRYREDHLELAREFHSVHRARISRQRSYYASNDRDRRLDLSHWEAAQLWPLLDRAARLGMVCVHSTSGKAELAPYRRGEINLDVISAPGDDGVSVSARLVGHGADELAPLVPLRFLGSSGHGLIYVDPSRELPHSTISLVRLAREVPAQLQAMFLTHHQVHVPAGDLAQFRSQLAPKLRAVAPLVSSDDSFFLPEISAPELVLGVEYGEGHAAALDWHWRYHVDGQAVEISLDEGDSGLRDLDAEAALVAGLGLGARGLARLGALGPGGLPARQAVDVAGFGTQQLAEEILPALESLPGLHIETRGEPQDYRDVDAALEIVVSTGAIGDQTDWFDLDVTIRVEGHDLPFDEVFTALAHGEPRMLLDDGAHFSLKAPELEDLRRLIEEARALGDGGRPGQLRISRYQAGLWRDLVGLGIAGEQAAGWDRQVDALRELGELPERPTPAGMSADLRPYQLEGFNWLASLWELGLGGILADDMGLGKTLQALALICHARAAGESAPFLVIAPTSVVGNWVTEAARFAPELAVMALTDTLGRSGLDIATVAEGADVVVCTYTLARLDAERYESVAWAGVILDEAQAVKNHHSKTHATIRRMPAPFKLAITGTPMENHLGELWALLSITAPGLFPDPDGFDKHYGRPIQRAGDAQRLAELRGRIRPLLKRRRKELVAADLPAKQEQLLEVSLERRHRTIYDRQLQRERQRILGLLDDFDTNRFSILTGITRLRQLSLHPGLVDPEHLSVPAAKLDVLSEHLQEVIDGGHRALVFSQFTGFLGLVRERLKHDGVKHCYLDGRTRQRAKVLSAFKDGDAPVFLISLKAGGAGLNLVEADYCFLLDPWWNPAVENQAIDRTHRIGQTRQVMVYRLVSEDTIEQKVVALAQRKAALFTGVLDEGELFSSQISAEDIRGLLG